MTIHQPTAAVRESFGQAQQQAAAMVAGPPTPWHEATRSQRGSARWLGIAAVSVGAAVAAGWLAADWVTASPRGGAVPSTGTAALPSTAAALPPPLPPIAPPAITTPPLADVPVSLNVARESGVIRIEASNARLADAVRALARATRTHVQGGEALAAIAMPVTLQWQGSDVAAAWDALLGRFASIGVACSGAGCELWVVGVTPPAPAAARAASAGPGMAPVAAEQGAVSDAASPPRPARAQPAAPAADEDTETN